MKVFLLGTGGPKPDPNRQDPSLAVQVDRTILLFASANLGGGWSAGAYQQIAKNMQKNFSSIHKPPASIRFAPIKHTLAVSVEPFKFSPAEPVAYELSQKCRSGMYHVSS
jgi:hypothetical protein